MELKDTENVDLNVCILELIYIKDEKLKSIWIGRQDFDLWQVPVTLSRSVSESKWAVLMFTSQSGFGSATVSYGWAWEQLRVVHGQYELES